jgi:hypothetical protein
VKKSDKHVQQSVPLHAKKPARLGVSAGSTEPQGLQLAAIEAGRPMAPATVLRLQRLVGNASVQRLLDGRRVSTPTVQRQKEEGKTFTQILAEAIMSSPKLLASVAKDRSKDVTDLFSKKQPGDLYFTDLETVYWGFGKLIFELEKMPEGSTTTEEQRKRFETFSAKWGEIQAGIAADAKRRVKNELARAREAAEALRVQLLYAYRDIYAAGKEPGDVKMGNLDTVKGVTEKVTDLLKAINEADAAVTGRSVTPLIPVLDKTLTIVNVITGWKVTQPLAAPASRDMARLQNALSLANAGLSLSGFGKFLPLFGYIGPLLDGIAKGWDRLVSALSRKNRLWWEAKEIMGEDLPHPDTEPGGKPVFDYMKSMFRASEPPSSPPPKSVLDFFYDNKKMFDAAMKEVMGKPWSRVPTRRAWLILSETDPKEINSWVYYNRDTIWRLIYGRGMEPPK